MRIAMKRLTVVTVVLAMMCVILMPICAFAKTEENFTSTKNATADYREYLEANKGASRPAKRIVLDASTLTYVDDEIEKKQEYQGENDVLVFSKKGGKAIYSLSVEEDGLYQVALNYIPTSSGDNMTSVVGILVDGVVPYSYCNDIELVRPWANKGDKTVDSRGNEIRAEQEEVYYWSTNVLYDSEGRYNDGLYIYLTKGAHEFCLNVKSGGFALKQVLIFNDQKLPSYNEVKSEYEANNYKRASGDIKYMQAEDYSVKSSSTILADYDKSDCYTQPNSATKMLLNIIPSSKYQSPGQWLSWETDVEEAGLYSISIRARQKEKSGFTVSRRLYIDGEVPFEECNNISFKSSNKWYIKTLGDESGEWLFYLEKGKHTFTLEVTPGSFAETTIAIDDCIYRLNALYRKTLMAVGTTVDAYRDYKISDIPGIVDEIKALKALLEEQEQAIIALNDGSGSSLSAIRTLINTLKVFEDEPDKLIKMKDTFKSNIESLSAWNLSAKQQPLDVDYIALGTENAQLPKASAGFFESIWFEVQRLVASFAKDYGTIGDVYNEEQSIDVWIYSLGRDQLQILKEQVDSSFVKDEKIAANLSLVSTGINEAVLAGTTPDVALFLSSDQPINLAVRGALVDLSKFDTFDAVKSRFGKESMLPYEYKGATYAIPITQIFNIMYVRTDIFEELGLKVPNTWREMYNVASVLQRNNMEIGIPTNLGTFITILLQNGGNVYNSDFSSTEFSSSAAITAFKNWTDFFTQYDFPLQYDFYNRFRSGEMPIGIAGYTEYTRLKEAAPEINGLWEIYLVPGTEQSDGTIDRTINNSEANGMTVNPGLTQNLTAGVMFENSKNKANAWRFIDWFTTTEVQVDYGINLEATMGETGRYTPANIEAFGGLAWDNEVRELLLEQQSWLVTVNEIPGSYYITRNINNAFRAVVNQDKNPTETLNKYSALIDKELERKLAEFAD